MKDALSIILAAAEQMKRLDDSRANGALRVPPSRLIRNTDAHFLALLLERQVLEPSPGTTLTERALDVASGRFAVSALAIDTLRSSDLDRFLRALSDTPSTIAAESSWSTPSRSRFSSSWSRVICFLFGVIRPLFPRTSLSRV